MFGSTWSARATVPVSVAQWLERAPLTREIPGSNPRSTWSVFVQLLIDGIARTTPVQSVFSISLFVRLVIISASL